VLEYFAPEDKENDDTDFHKEARIQSQSPVDTADDKNLTLEEIAITGEIYKSTFEIFPGYITALYNGFLRRGVFPTRWKGAQLIPITKPGKENSEDISKFCPVSLLNIGGKYWRNF
jgi:hypothetical protein